MFTIRRALHNFLFIVFCLFTGSDSSAQERVVIESFDQTGTLMFGAVTNALSYQVEWAPEPNGPWTNDLPGLTNISGEVTGVVTVVVPLLSGTAATLYRIAAWMTDPPAVPDFAVSNLGTSAYSINGSSNPTLTLFRGNTYVIQVNSPGHPFWIKTAATTGTGNQYNDGLSTNGIQTGSITFTVPSDAPDTLYYICQFHSSMQGVINIEGIATPEGMSLIPAGAFMMGDSFEEGDADELPRHSVTVSAFFMDKYEVTLDLWNEVASYSSSNGYSFANTGTAKDTNHPVCEISWYDAVKWCNARSEMEGLTPVYYTDAGVTIVYKAGDVAPTLNGTANGYRLPTEAEWEKAARGGVDGNRFPWQGTNSITHERANYISVSITYSYDESPDDGLHPVFNDDSPPLSNPVGYFAPNGYGLYDMAGNVFEWCGDFYQADYYSNSPNLDPPGPATGIQGTRVYRGGSWGNDADAARVAKRFSRDADDTGITRGFRCVRGNVSQ